MHTGTPSANGLTIINGSSTQTATLMIQIFNLETVTSTYLTDGAKDQLVDMLLKR